MNPHTADNARAAPRIDLHGAHVPRTSLRQANLTNADLSHANASGVDFTGANMAGTKLDGTILKGAILTGVKGLTIEQLKQAVIDEATRLPDYIDRSRI
jgi:uncharacterized protein YjbI with pentapeptide repeats